MSHRIGIVRNAQTAFNQKAAGAADKRDELAPSNAGTWGLPPLSGGVYASGSRRVSRSVYRSLDLPQNGQQVLG
jgi:hypothetical protein